MRLGGVIGVLDSLGPAPRSDWSGPSRSGNDIFLRFDEDLALLAEVGVAAVRVGFDWARLFPIPGRPDDDWREWYEHVLLAGARHGVEVWATLHETTVPAWFDDEGSFADASATGKWWPRWVEWCAEAFGDRVAGWFPFHDPVGAAARWSGDSRKHEVALVATATAWRDAWRILRGGPPVATSLRVAMARPADQTVPAAQAARLEDQLRWRLWTRGLRDGVVRLPNGKEHVVADLAGALDVLGVATALDLPEGRVSDDALRRWEEQLGSIVRRAAEEGPDRPLALSALRVAWPQDDERRLLVEASARALQAAVADGVDLRDVFVDPAIGGGAAASLVDRDRATTSVTAVWRSIVR